MKFRFKADVTFEAKDIDDAFRVLEQHFRDIPEGNDIEAELVGDLEIGPVESVL